MCERVGYVEAQSTNLTLLRLTLLHLTIFSLTMQDPCMNLYFLLGNPCIGCEHVDGFG
jgi:hypothetical protein